MKLINTAVGLLSSMISRSPFYIRFQVTFRCNYRCRMCGQDHEKGKELSLKEIAVVAKRLADFGSRHLVLTGGNHFCVVIFLILLHCLKRKNFLFVRRQTVVLM